jgi:hypothetical protein
MRQREIATRLHCRIFRLGKDRSHGRRGIANLHIRDHIEQTFPNSQGEPCAGEIHSSSLTPFGISPQTDV